jgi:hypothetical protein
MYSNKLGEESLVVVVLVSPTLFFVSCQSRNPWSVASCISLPFRARSGPGQPLNRRDFDFGSEAQKKR